MRPDHATGVAAVSAGSARAAAAAVAALDAGGTAIDAVIAGSAAQCVVEMPWCGIGGDAFVLARSAGGEVTAFNGSGAAPAGILGVIGPGDRVPRFGPTSVAVPAIVDAWSQVHERFGRRPFAELFEPARRLAADGFPLDARLAAALSHLHRVEGGEQLGDLLTGRDTSVGAVFIQPDLAATVETIAREGRDGFYRGRVAERIAAHLAQRGGCLGTGDLAGHSGEWVAPLSVQYRGTRVWSNGLVSTGILLLLGLRTLELRWPAALPDDELQCTTEMVALKRLLFEEVSALLGDPRATSVPDVLADGTAAGLARRLGNQHRRRGAVVPAASDTTSLAVVDDEGASACIIHSLFNEFGSRELVPGTGIVLNDRLANLVALGNGDAPNALVPGRRPLHTLHTYLVEWPDGSFAVGATPGGRGQVQTNLQVVTRLVDRDEPVQSAVVAPRWVHGMPRTSADDDTLYVEEALGHLADGLTAAGHCVEVVDDGDGDRFGNCTVVARRGGRTEAAADHRRGGAAWTSEGVQ